MAAEPVLSLLLETGLAASAAVVLVLLLRVPVRSAFGARAAYLLWGLVPLAMLAVLPPGPLRDSAWPIESWGLPSSSPVEQVTVGSAQAVDMAHPAPGWPIGSILVWAWALGALLAASWFAWQQWRLVRGLGPLVAGPEGTLRATRGTAGCPAVVGAWMPRIVLPQDFDTRYSPQAARLVLEHERVHLRRGDTRVQLLVAALRCAYWFNPLLHVAAVLLRRDQELACDAVVLARHPDSRRDYADAMLNTQLAVLGLPVGCHWQSSRSLKERIMMMGKPIPGAARRGVGVAAVAALLAAGSYAAWALQPATTSAPSYRGDVNEHGVAIARLTFPSGRDAGLSISGGNMAGPRDGSRLGVLLDTWTRTRIEKSDGQDDQPEWRLSLQGRGSPQAPVVEWTIERGGLETASGQQPIRADGERLVLPEDARRGVEVPDIAFHLLPADGVVTRELLGGSDTASEPAPSRTEFVLDPDGAYRQRNPIHSFSSNYGVDGGSATLLGHVDVQGRVARVDIESDDPAGSLDPEEATKLFARMVFEPRRVDGRPVPSRIRVPVTYWKNTPQWREPVVAAATFGNDVAPGPRTPPPPYPPQALAERIEGQVVLHLLVRVDGSVADARVMHSHPEGVFDTVSIEAARQWTLDPPERDGEPVEGWLRVPITFRPHADPDQRGG